MSFWQLSDGEDAAKTGGTFEVGGGDMEPIPSGSSVLAIVDDARWREAFGDESKQYIELRWSVLKPEEYKNRKVFQKLWVEDLDPNAKDEQAATRKRDKARRLLAAIDHNAGGKLTSNPNRPTDDSLMMCLANKPMVLSLQVWSMEDRDNPGQKRQGNWVSKVGPKTDEVKAAAPKSEASQGGGWGGFQQGNSHDDDDLDTDSIPF